MTEAIRVVISGRVQGVGYRAWTIATASRMGIKGWVRNRSDGSVEAMFSGEEAQLQTMIEACKEGPATARVNKIESYRWTDILYEDGFTAKPTL